MSLTLPSPLQEQYKFEHDRLTSIVKQYPWESVEAYSQYLGQSYFYAKRSTRILALASACFDHDKTALHYRFLDHAREEKGHEILLINDLRTLGKSIDDIQEFPETSVFYQNLFYWIQNKNPIGLFGWVLNLEGFAIEDGDYIYNRVVDAHGKKAATFLKVHSSEDIEHIQSAVAFFDKLNDDEITMIGDNFSQCSILFNAILQKIISRSHGANAKA
ncbi:iron-containing redox enzyme family protein [Pseudobacteriovorax antillogorgiicola]|uniref:Iron-containing redox enzyme n=1 Tax=Pseudobacteriovorax antillogorgiicola TaxID=1513793 RepID=A0A1Y6CSG1_9BACT|nr:iron-containing redox enzyme family protein [Pseudobacteriovorax antillogorgiicola]TCS45680.1 heme oxygenase-like protein [Pseudobacteriovorax antillogorgiicola]SMF73152.1 Iron-containing redox enzyme [Pseudobacteriovorax antillogorgiicola]